MGAVRRRLGDFETKSLPLGEGEELIMSTGVNAYFSWLRNVPGMLYLTNKRLMLLPYKLVFWEQPHEWEVTEVTGFGRQRPWYIALGFMFLIKPWYFEAGQSRYYVHSLRIEEWLAALSKATGLEMGATDAR